MSAIFWKNFYICFSKIKCLSTTLPPPSEEDYNHQSTTTTLVKNFNSLYSLTSDSTTTTKSLTSTSSSHFFSSSDDSDDTDHYSPPDFATIFASQRFFFSSPGHSNSILDSPPQPHSPVTGGVAVQTYSPDPYLDFRQSMQEMVEARQPMDVTANWEYLHELLLCYLSLNPQHTHKFIIGAFADLLVSLMPETTTDNHRRLEKHQRTTSTSRLLPASS